LKGLPPIEKALRTHEGLADKTQLIFSVLTPLFALLIFLPKMLKRPLKRKLEIILTVIFLLLYGGGAVALSMTAHEGGILVHSLKVTASV
jgi:hypothetical protein